MIEFKGECGHTIRAKDDDAGKVVRCSYCGKEAQVPEEEDELDFLLTEVERTGDFDPPKSRRRTKPRPSPAAGPPIRPKSDFNPFSVALKMCYAALIVTVLIVVGKGVYKRVVVDASPKAHESGPLGPVKPGAGAAEPQAPAGDTERGLLTTRLNLNESGIYVTSVPVGAEVYVRDAKNAGDTNILKDQNIRHRCRAGEPVQLGAGTYEVGVSLQFTDPGLMSLPGYGELREAIEFKTDESAGEKLEKYFIHHGQQRVDLGTLADQSRVIVMYYNVEVDRNSWTPCTALFLPARSPLSELMTYLPKNKSFGFDVEAVRGELSFYKVPVEDQTFILDTLARIGMVPYRRDPTDAKAPYQVFWIRLVDGKVSTRLLNPKNKSG